MNGMYVCPEITLGADGTKVTPFILIDDLLLIGICLSHFFACFGFLVIFFIAFLTSFLTGLEDFFLRFGHLSIDTGM